MSPSPASFNTPNPMKKKIITALAAVVIGHVGVLWAVSHIKTIELKPIEKEPLKVKFVKIKEPPKAEPPKPKETPKPEPKKEVKEVKVVEKPVAPPPKKIEKVQQVKEAPKPVLQKTEPKVEPKVETTVVSTKVSEKVTEKPQPVQEVEKPQPAADPSPKTVSIGGAGIQWSRSPKISFTPKDLENQTRLITVYIEADEKGRVTTARITRSSGLPNLDEKALRAVRNAKFKPYMENGVAYPIKTEQPFEFNP